MGSKPRVSASLASSSFLGADEQSQPRKDTLDGKTGSEVEISNNSNKEMKKDLDTPTSLVAQEEESQDRGRDDLGPDQDDLIELLRSSNRKYKKTESNFQKERRTLEEKLEEKTKSEAQQKT